MRAGLGLRKALKALGWPCFTRISLIRFYEGSIGNHRRPLTEPPKKPLQEPAKRRPHMFETAEELVSSAGRRRTSPFLRGLLGFLWVLGV